MTKLLTLYRPKPRTKPSTDILVIPEVVRLNQEKLTRMAPRKRRVNYAKKIMNDQFIFTV